MSSESRYGEKCSHCDGSGCAVPRCDGSCADDPDSRHRRCLLCDGVGGFVDDGDSPRAHPVSPATTAPIPGPPTFWGQLLPMIVPFGGGGSLEDFIAILVLQLPYGNDWHYTFACPVEFALRLARGQPNVFFCVDGETPPWTLHYQRGSDIYAFTWPAAWLENGIRSSLAGLEALLESAGGLERVHQLEDAARRASRTNQAFADWVLFGSAKPLVFLRAPGGVAVYA